MILNKNIKTGNELPYYKRHKMKRKHLWQLIALCLYLGSVQCVHSQDAYQLGEEALQYGNYEQKQSDI